jgi:hypothetical protein
VEKQGTLLKNTALDNWHNDGDFFVHFLDSPEQALLVIPLWSDIEHKGGGTAICGDGIKYIAKHLVLSFSLLFRILYLTLFSTITQKAQPHG